MVKKKKSKKRSKKYDRKLSIKGNFDDVLKASLLPKKDTKK